MLSVQGDSRDARDARDARDTRDTRDTVLYFGTLWHNFGTTSGWL